MAESLWCPIKSFIIPTFSGKWAPEATKNQLKAEILSWITIISKYFITLFERNFKVSREKNEIVLDQLCSGP